MGWPGGLSFVVAAGTTTDTTNTFLHELGHNILGDGSSIAPYGSHRDGDGHTKQKSKNCAMYAYVSSAHDYCPESWQDLNLEICNSSYSGGF